MSENPGESPDLDAPAASSPEPLKFDTPHFDLVEKGADSADIETRAVDGD